MQVAEAASVAYRSTRQSIDSESDWSSLTCCKGHEQDSSEHTCEQDSEDGAKSRQKAALRKKLADQRHA